MATTAEALAMLQANVARTVSAPRVDPIGASGEERITLAETKRREAERNRVLNSIPFGKPKYLGLGIVSREMLEEGGIASCEITKESIPKAHEHGVRKTAETHGTLFDTLMGSEHEDGRCSTCSEIGAECGGHYGKLIYRRKVCGKLVPNPVFHPGFVDITAQIMQCTCGKCGAVILKDMARKRHLQLLNPRARIKKIAKESIGIECACGGGANPIYKISKTDSNVILKQYEKKGQEYPLYPLEAYKVLTGISEDDLELLGYNTEFTWSNSPADLLLFGNLVMPPRMRPATRRNGVTEEDDFTRLYVNILKASNAIANYVPPPSYTPANIEEAYFALSRELMRNIRELLGGRGAGKGGEEGTKTTKAALGGKKGAFRAIINGKRTNYSARTVAGPGSRLKANEVGIPETYAATLTFPDRVFRSITPSGQTVTNADELTEMLRKGRVRTIIREGRKIRITEVNRIHITLQVGDIVNRWMRTGDKIIVNRNPSLHKYNTQALDVVLMPIEQILIATDIVGGYNADFDGDELNLHFPQTIEAVAEMQQLLDPKFCALSTSRGGVILASIGDSVGGNFLLTRPFVRFTRERWLDGFDALAARQYDLGEFFIRAAAHGYNPYTGRGLFSVVLPPDLGFRTNIKDPQQWIETIVNEDGSQTQRPVTENQLIIENGLLLKGSINGDHIGKGGSLSTYVLQMYGEDFYINFITDVRWLADWYLLQEGQTIGLADCVTLDVQRAAAERQQMDAIVQQSFAQALSYGGERKNPIEEARRQENVLAALDSSRNKIVSLMRDKFSRSNLGILAHGKVKGSAENAAMMYGVLGTQTIRGQLLPRGLGSGPDARVTFFYPRGSTDPRATIFAESNMGTGVSPHDYLMLNMTSRVDIASGKINVADAGYDARMLNKALEDVRVAYDGTVRRGKGGAIVQYVAYDIGIDPGHLQRFSDDYGMYFSYIDLRNVVFQINAGAAGVVLTGQQIRDIVTLPLPSAEWPPPAGTPRPKYPGERFTIFSSIDQAVRTAHENLLTRQLTGLTLVDTPETREKLRDEILRGLRRASITPADATGPLTASGTGEILTQALLKSKSNVGTGSSARLRSQTTQLSTLLNVPKQPKHRMSYIYFNPPLPLRDVYRRMKQFEYILIGKLIVEMDPQPAVMVDRSWYVDFARIFNRVVPDERNQVLRIKFSTALLYRYNITLEDIAASLRPRQPILFYSPNNLGIIDIYQSETFVGTDSTVSDQEYYFLKHVVMPAVASHYFSGIPKIEACSPNYVPLTAAIQAERRLGGVTGQSTQWRLTRNALVERWQPVRLSHLIPLLVEAGFVVTSDPDRPADAIVVSAGPGVPAKYVDAGPKATLCQLADTPGNFDRYHLSYLETFGTNLVRTLLVPGVNQQFTYSDDAQEMAVVFGVEASGEMYFNDFTQVLESVIPIHAQLLQNFMYLPGRPTAVNRFGLAQQSKGAVSLASFERAQESIFEQAGFNPIEAMDVNPSTMTGQLVPVGTGAVEIITPADIAENLERLQRQVERGEVPYPEKLSNTAEDELANIRLFSGNPEEAVGDLPPIPASIFGAAQIQIAEFAPVRAGSKTTVYTPTQAVNLLTGGTITQAPPITPPNIIPTMLPKSIAIIPPNGALVSLVVPSVPVNEFIIPSRPTIPVLPGGISGITDPNIGSAPSGQLPQPVLYTPPVTIPSAIPATVPFQVGVRTAPKAPMALGGRPTGLRGRTVR